MFKKSLKTLALITTTYTVAEYLTMWRMQNERMSLKEFTKRSLKGQSALIRDAYQAGYRTTAGIPGEKVSDLVFKKYPI